MKNIKETSTRIFKSLYGWSGETITTVKNQTYAITTQKNHGLITSNAQPGKASEDANSKCFRISDMFTGNIPLISEKARATEKSIRNQHLKAVLLFDEKVKNGEITSVVIETPVIGSILFLHGYGKTKGSPENKKIVYKIETDSWGDEAYFTVELDTLKLTKNTHVKPYSKKFGIGTYFEPDYKFKGSQDDINNLLISAHAAEKEQTKKNKAEKDISDQINQDKIEIGQKLVQIPTKVKGLIVADRYSNDSDYMTDYYSVSIIETLYLAFTNSARNNMSEMKIAAKNCELSKKLLLENDTKETRRSNSYLPDFYIGDKSWSGWKINKKVIDLSRPENRDLLYIAAAEGRYFIPQQ